MFSPYHRITVSPYHRITASPFHRITILPPYSLTPLSHFLPTDRLTLVDKIQLMKNPLLYLFLLLLLSCQEQKKDSEVEKSRILEQEIPPGNVQEERAALQSSNEDRSAEEAEEIEAKEEIHIDAPGKYQRLSKGEAKTDCNCDCIDIDFEKPTEWCIVKDKVYISARSQKTGAKTADLYFINSSRDEETERSIPWKQFDTGTPIATIQFQPDGTAEIDWIGFSINGEVATDYAIYGKKTIEGTYKKY
jgi:zinc D-Ala-D-Ala carboxypeptidase